MVLNGIPISDDQCIGDSLDTINSAFQTLSTASIINAADTSTIDLTLTNRTLSASVFNNSVTNSKLAFDGGSFAFRNKIINGNFDIWQRGISLASGTWERFLADRFLNTSVGSTYTVSQQPFTLGQNNVPNEPTYFHRTVVTSSAGNGNYASFVQRIESVKTLANKNVTLSFYAKADSNKQMSVDFAQEFGTEGSPSSQVNGIGVQKINLTTSWQKFTVTVGIPSISGKTLGTNNNNCLAVNFWFDAGSDLNSRTYSLGQQSGTFDIAQVQLEEGSVATPFELRPIGTELALCQRYYCKSYPLAVVPGTIYHDTGAANFFPSQDITTSTIVTVINGSARYPVTMRAIPTVVIYSPNETNVINRVGYSQSESAGVYKQGTSIVASGNSSDGITEVAILGMTTSNWSNNYAAHQFHYTASAEL